MAAGCGSDGRSAVEPGDEAAEFCRAVASLEGERSEGYVGSEEHVSDATSLAARASESVREPAEVYRDFIANGGVDSADLESYLVLNWPDDVQTAIADLTEFISANC